MVIGVGARDHLCLHVAAETNFYANVVLLNHLLKLILDMYDVAQPIGLPGK